MKYWKHQTPRKLAALYLALNWFLTDREDELGMPDSLASTEVEASCSSEELERRLALRCVGRFRTKRLRKKHREIIKAPRREPEVRIDQQGLKLDATQE